MVSSKGPRDSIYNHKFCFHAIIDDMANVTWCTCFFRPDSWLAASELSGCAAHPRAAMPPKRKDNEDKEDKHKGRKNAKKEPSGDEEAGEPEAGAAGSQQPNKGDLN